MSPALPVTPDDFHSDRLPLPYLQKALETVAKRCGFKEPRYDVRKGTKAGDNFASLIYRVVISDRSDRSRTHYSVIVKSPLPTANNANIAKLYRRAFKNEVNAYKSVLFTYAEKLQEKGLIAADAYYPDVPRFLLASLSEDDDNQDVVILEDMLPEGFVMHDRMQAVDQQHCRLALGFLANLHASSFAMERLHPEEFHRLLAPVEEMFQEGEDLVKMFDKESLTKNVYEIVGKRFPEGSPLYEKAKEYCSVIRQDVLKLVAPDPSGGNVLCHGDAWLNNLLFKYSESGQPERVCFLDFQVTRYASPVLDLAYFLFSSTDKSLRDEHLDSLLRHDYHAALQARLRALGVEDPDAVFSWQRFQEHLRQFGRFGFAMGLMIIPALTVDRDNAPVLTERLQDQDGASIVDACMMNCKDTTRRDARIAGVLQDMVERGFL